MEEFFKKHGITDLENLENLDSQKIKTAFQNMDGRTVWLVRKNLGTERLRNIFKLSGLINETISLEKIININKTYKI